MANALTLGERSPGRVKGVERAQRAPAGRFHALAHLMDIAAVERACDRQRADAAVGVDGITKAQYGQSLAANLQDLHARLQGPRYRHQPIRRVYIPQGQGQSRPIGIAAFEDTLVHDAVREVLEALYAQDGVDGSYGLRPTRSAQDAGRSLERIGDRGEGRWIVEADMVSFVDSVDRTTVTQMLEGRVADGSLVRLMGTCVHVGGLDGEALYEPEVGAVQGSVLSPLVGNVSRHDGLDCWVETEVTPRLRGHATLMRYADDFVIGLEHEDDARRMMAVRAKRWERFGLPLHPDTTRLVPFGRPPKAQHRGKGPATCDCVGCTV